jgi:hypothetical protein
MNLQTRRAPSECKIQESSGVGRNRERISQQEEENLAILRPNLLLSLSGTNMKKSCVASTLRHETSARMKRSR